VPSPERPHLIRFLERAKEGMQQPPIFEASDHHRYVLKLDTMLREFPAIEMVGAGLARAFEVPLPAYGVLDAPTVLVDALLSSGDSDYVEFAESFARTGHCCFGSRYLDGVVVKWQHGRAVNAPDAQETLVRLLVFDSFIENGDRTSATNPNLLVSNGRMFAIDHGQALPSVQGVRSTFPFAFDSHLAWTTAQQRPDMLDRPIQDLRELSDTAIEAAIAAVPDSWWAEPARPNEVCSALCLRRDALPDTLQQLRERLS
jgi:hypothetical protein